MSNEEPRPEHVRELLHELRGPLGALAALAELVDEPVRGDVLDVLDHIRSVLSRVESPAGTSERFPVGRVLSRAALLTRSTTTGPLVDIDAGADLYAVGDADAVGQIVVNLLVNAFRYSPADAVVTVRARRVDDRAVIEVCDRGPGVTLGEDAFVGGVTAEPGRTGIGLALSRRLAEQMGGTLELGPQEHGGCLVLTLPAA